MGLDEALINSQRVRIGQVAKHMEGEPQAEFCSPSEFYFTTVDINSAIQRMVGQNEGK